MSFLHLFETSGRPASLLLLALTLCTPLTAGTISQPDPETQASPYALAMDYSWTQLFSLEDPATLDALSQLAGGSGPALFLMTGNTANNGSGPVQIQVIGSNAASTVSPVVQTTVPEPSLGVLCALLLVGLVAGCGGFDHLSGHLKLAVEIKKVRRR
jgi:hypothetical protein